jgi:hypothetical protein
MKISYKDIKNYLNTMTFIIKSGKNFFTYEDIYCLNQ